MTETQAMVAKVPVLHGETQTVTMMSYGFDPYISSWSPYHGAVWAVTESLSKIVAAGGCADTVHFTFQEYFQRMTEDPVRWSQPFTALLGAYEAQRRYGLASIGGKDSMSGTFNKCSSHAGFFCGGSRKAQRCDHTGTEGSRRCSDVGDSSEGRTGSACL